MWEIKIKFIFLPIILFFIFACPLILQAHPSSDTFLDLTIKEGKLTGQINVPADTLFWITDFNIVKNSSPEVLAAAISTKRELIISYILSHLTIKGNEQNCQLTPSGNNLSYYPTGPYFTLLFNLDCGFLPSTISVDYNLYFDRDTQHNAFINVRGSAAKDQTYILTKENSHLTINLSKPSPWRQLLEFILSGMRHIWTGYDHLLFILILLLPTVIRPPIIKNVLKVISSFTIAHSITLTLAVLRIIMLPSRLVESVIALSIVFAALTNILFPNRKDHWIIAFVFGLVHGFGFAAVLQGFGLSRHQLVIGLFGFNVGVEIGQLVVVTLLIPILYLLSHKQWNIIPAWSLSITNYRKSYSKYMLPACSGMAALLALVWFIERAFYVKLF